jgi:hypothetical protein
MCRSVRVFLNRKLSLCHSPPPERNVRIVDSDFYLSCYKRRQRGSASRICKRISINAQILGNNRWWWQITQWSSQASGHHGYCGLASWTRSDKVTLIEQKGLGENSSGWHDILLPCSSDVWTSALLRLHESSLCNSCKIRKKYRESLRLIIFFASCRWPARPRM